ncbi:MAG: PAS domain-containing sensor histidine kinase [Polaromonas sp. 39-63-203]|jgi:two-component system sensor histidine kinase PilS (NtrC family)|uniref:ATP-binding protein n=1 Tax=Polaromonas sp. TaxID=1869339 RepID=UPI000BCB111F|nr:ATP-binding protein [Polaromonas sp.]OYY53859.1 MAG: PAS domain-containing sensor histidine kinase [Polaromonas sp. 35-63-240]OYZ85040.1 MAG: PAS domain-containing sensor histidine kinase [Polaromonas sp. 24-62-144]OZB02338.1 MAG: PAS domain-containing sensor histidine kinase [Polaromonas sp. 39-63-203]HQS30725.1 histidine kinase dimerization/phospho-acceptor domain-containing protein [Polaromonas sp.]HQS89936.1 histidine kinase dimerization/phospho-acceptor domain-containing protein [Polar
MDSQFHSWLASTDSLSPAPEVDPGSQSFDRLWRVFMTARVAIATVLVVLQAFIYALGNNASRSAAAVCIAYLFATLAVRIWARPRPPRRAFDAQWLLTIGVDVLAFSALDFLQSGVMNYTPLFALPVLLSSVLGPILLAFGTAASVTVLLLADAWWTSLQSLADFNARFLQAALSGSGFFLVALLANQLAARLSREEERSQASQSAARMQNQVNQLVIEGLAEGVLVIDARGTVRSVNPASGRLLATKDAARNTRFVLTREKAWQPLVEVMRRTFETQTAQEAEVSLDYPAHGSRRLHVRTRLAKSKSGSNESMCVMFLEDLREMEARVRTEKLAAMGRMSAAVAHEIRNPLAAIAQANALLEEDLRDPGHRQLTSMVRQNAQRLAKIVDEILNVSRAKEQLPAPAVLTLVLDDAVEKIASEWAVQNGTSHRLQVVTRAAHAAVWFEPDHLRRLMVNLLDNALRYASASPQAIQVSTESIAPGKGRLAVWSDGQRLEKTVQAHLFEPFFSSESRSSGLGLYICRELCERYGALIGYQRALRGTTEGNEFFVVLNAGLQPLNDQSPLFEATPLAPLKS